jgi:hypothetical protein
MVETIKRSCYTPKSRTNLPQDGSIHVLNTKLTHRSPNILQNISQAGEGTYHGEAISNQWRHRPAARFLQAITKSRISWAVLNTVGNSILLPAVRNKSLCWAENVNLHKMTTLIHKYGHIWLSEHEKLALPKSKWVDIFFQKENRTPLALSSGWIFGCRESTTRCSKSRSSVTKNIILAYIYYHI